LKLQFLRGTFVIATLSALLSIVGCGGSGSATHTAQSAQAPKLTSIAITGAAGNLDIGATRQYTATGTYNDGSSRDITSSLNWTTSNASVAKVSSGLVTALAAGSSTVTASLDSASSKADIVVNPALSNVVISSPNPALTIGSSVSLTATGVFTDSSTKDLTGDVSWSSSDSAVASVASNGQVTILAAGDCTITASIKGVAFSFHVHVPANVNLVSISMTGASSSPLAGGTLQLFATGTYSDSSSQDLSNAVSWTTSDSSLATIDATGLVTLLAAGNVDITGTLNGVTSLISLQVKPYLVSIDVLPSNSAIELGTSQQLMASGNYSDGSQRDLSDQVEWAATDSSIGSVDAHGMANALSTGSTTITASLNDVAGSTSLTVHPPHLTAIVINQDGTTVPNGLPLLFSATGLFSDESTSPISGVTYSSSDPSVVSIDENGVASSHNVGTVVITATFGSITGTASVTISPAALVSISSNPPTQSLPLGLQQQLSVDGSFTDSNTKPITAGVLWESSDTAVATVDENGLVSTTGTGSATITATVNSLTSSSVIEVNAARLISIAVTPTATSMPAGATQQFSVAGTYTNGSVQDLTSTAVWVSSDGSVVNIDGNGLAIGISPGSVTISASVGEISGSSSLEITNAVPTGLVITPQGVTAAKGTNVQYKATVYYSDGTSRDMTKLVTWSSSVPATVNINNAGLATAHKLGTVTISARLGSQTSTTSLSVIP
jgi:trimeric autotransporter adhesin